MTRVRLAPSPTGYLHVGTLRTALYCYLLAKKNDGSFFLRIEDTDQKRFVEGSVENLLQSLRWAGIEPNEGVVLNDEGHIDQTGDYGPYIQSERLPIYHKYAKQLIDSGHAYYCFCTAERLAKMREEQIKNKRPPMYDRKCLYLSDEEKERLIQAGEPYVIRQKIPRERTVVIEDIVRGTVKFNCATLDDQVLVKSDGYPTYHLAHAVDDHLMKTQPVIRGEEWLPSAAKHVLLFEALGFEVPKFAHLPLLLNKDRTKLSKRQGDVAVEDYMKKGYLPEAIINFVAFLGWNPGTEQELFSLEELVDAFSLERVNKAGAIFDIEKLNWYNSQYIRKKNVPEVTDLVIPFLREAGFNVDSYSRNYLENCIGLVYERLQYFAEAPSLMTFFFEEPEYSDGLIVNEKMKITREIALQALEESYKALEVLGDFSRNTIKEELVKVIAKLELKNGQVLWPMRAVLTGEKFSPGAFEVAEVLGKEATLKRMKKGIEKLQ